MSGREIVFLILGLAWMCSTARAMGWWLRARTIWLSRLSARGVLAGTYTPAPANVWLGGLRWLLRQRMPVSDMVRMTRLEDEADQDRVTEICRVRTTRRLRLVLAAGVGGLVVLGFLLFVYEFFGWQGFLVFLVLAAATGFFQGRVLYRRAREWGDYGADVLP